jgi:riboflavin kinase / FMN adenylyltransferase
MKVAELKDLHNIPVSFTLGSFDGFHLGHGELIKALLNECRKDGTSSLVMSFYPHPRQVVDTDYDLKLLNSREEKISLFEKSGIDFIHFINFTSSFSGTGYKEFYKNYIFANLNVRSIVAGENHGFGKGRKGNSALLSEICDENSVHLITVPPVFYSENHVSSTRIRHCIEDGNISDANKMLGYRYSLTGKVEKGKGIGRDLGFRTANINLENSKKAVPKKGVYITRVLFDSREFGSVTNVGFSPTLDGHKPELKMETHIFDFACDIYGKEITVYFLDKIRDEKKFSSFEELKKSVENDAEIAKLHFKYKRDAL